MKKKPGLTSQDVRHYEAAETAIDKTVEHYKKKVEFLNGPKVVKTFK